MTRLSSLFLIWAIGAGVISCDEENNGFVQPLDFGAIFGDDKSGAVSLASNPVAAAMLTVDKSQYPQLFDTIVSSSIDSLQSQSAPKQYSFDASNFGFNPIASQGYFPYGKPAKLVARPAQPQFNAQLTHTEQRSSPLRYDIRTVHDANYKVYKPEENEEGKDILAALKKDPTVSEYFQPTVNVEVNHPLKYTKEELTENLDGDENYKPNPYIPGPARLRRYAGGRREKLKKAEQDEDDDPYNYKADYISRPKIFDESPYSSPYTKKKKDSEDAYEYPYSYDSGYDHKEYERIKELSEKQAAEIKQNPGNCKEVKKDGMSCMSCKDPKTGGNYESCSYVAEPKNNKYAYSKENKYNSNDEPDEPENVQQSEKPKKAEKYKAATEDVSTGPQKFTSGEEKPSSSYKQADSSEDPKYKAYYVHTSQPKPSEALRAASDEDSSEESKPKAYNYKKAIPGFYTDNEPKKDVEHVLAEFKKKDRSACKKVQKNGMTCFQCIDKTGLKNEECMFVSESAPVKSHLAYQEVKEFTSKPATLEGTEEAESRTVTTSAPVQKSAAYVVANSNYGKKLKRKKTPQNAATATATGAKVKRSEGSEAESHAQIADETNIAPPEEFAGAESKPAFWSETMPRYSAALGVTLPEYMLSRSEHEHSFDETVAGV